MTSITHSGHDRSGMSPHPAVGYLESSPPPLTLRLDELSPSQEAVSLTTKGDGRLRSLLVALDLGGSLAVWAIVLLLTSSTTSHVSPFQASLTAVGLSALGVVLLAWQKLYRARICLTRAVEVGRLALALGICGVVALCVDALAGVGPPVAILVSGVGGSFVVLSGLRGWYSTWLRACRARGLYSRPVCIFGTNGEARALRDLLEDQPELGYRVTAMLGEAGVSAAEEFGAPVVPPGTDPALAARAAGATGVIVPVSAVTPDGLDRMVRHLSMSGLHVQVSTGLTRVGRHRMRFSPLSHQVLFYVEAPNLSGRRFLVKRVFDLAVSSLSLLMLMPVIVGAALAIKLDDGGPVFYRQKRVGRNGVLFDVVKFRSMVPDASAQLDKLMAMNERNGPLFKLSRDPRVTRIGRVLRATNIDELPQLFNVLRGEMSLVGPRPALPAEVAEFDDELRSRVIVPPGITGLWQVEASDSPSFEAYRRLDLFYVDNWSLGMDLAILFATIRVVLSRAIRSIRSDTDAAISRRERVEASEPLPGES